MAMKPKVAMAALGVALASSACGRQIGTKADGASVRSLTPGASTLQDAIARLARPPSRKPGLLGGRQTAGWTYLMDTGRGTESARVDMLFGADDRMIVVVQQREHLLDSDR